MRPIPIGATAELHYTVTDDKTVPRIYDEFPEFAQMPAVFATGLMVSLLEACCQRAILPYLDWPPAGTEGSLGTHVNFSHLAATPVGMRITVKARVTAVEGRKVSFHVEAWDSHDKITEGTHERTVVDFERFAQRVQDKATRPLPGAPA
ncbi:MAG: thioesterase family protein [Betaproteobacteria bacterium]|nr:thioesterase family protein [Betaproteobacteria bacterium]